MLEDPPLLTIRREIARPSADDLAPFHDCLTGWLGDAQDGRGALDAAIKPIDPDTARFMGPALTCWCGPNDNLAVLAAIALAQPGDVILCACEGFAHAGMSGDLTTGMARNRGVVAFVTDGMVRDADGIKAVGIPVFARGVTPNSCVRSGPGTVGLPILIGGARVESGDLLIGDRDGVVVAPRATLTAVAARVAAVREAERRAEEEVRNGLHTRDDIAELLRSSRVRWVE